MNKGHIQDVSKSLKQEFKAHMHRRRVWWFGYWVLLLALLIYQSYVEGVFDPSLAFFYILAGTVPLAIFSVYIQSKLRKKMVQQFLDTHGFKSDASPDIKTLKPRIFNVGHSKKISHYAKSAEHDMEYYHYEFTTGSGKESRRHSHDILKSHTRDSFGHIAIMGRNAGGVLPSANIFAWKRHSFESPEFNKKYRVYTKKDLKSGSGAYELLEPDVMQELIDMSIKTLTIELIDHEMYFIFHALPTKRSELEAILHLIEVFDE